MPLGKQRFLSLFLFISDFCALVAAFFISYFVRVVLDDRPLLLGAGSTLEYIGSVALIIPFWLLVFAGLGLYRLRSQEKTPAMTLKVLFGCFIGILGVIGWEYVSGALIFPARLVMIYVLASSFVLVLLFRGIVFLARRMIFRTGKQVRRVLLIGSSPVLLEVYEAISNSEKSGFAVVATCGTKKYAPRVDGIKHYTEVDEALGKIKRHKIDLVLQTSMFDNDEKNKAALHATQVNHIDYSFIPGEPEFYSGKNVVDVFFGFPMISVSQTPLVGWSVVFKRIMDLLAVAVSFPIWGVIFGIIVLFQKIFNPGPVFFKQTRIGLHGKKIKFYKFRTMRTELSGQNAIEIFEKMGRGDLAREYARTRKIANDPRIAGWFARFLRNSSMDELAQLINVVKGDLSLVGPRPILPDELDFYRSRAPLLLSVTPGLTGMASVSGRSGLSFAERVNLELFYAQNWSFWLDFKILVKTAVVVLTGRGAG
jgi:exopolysaccharide biosynthesis polyprenyl glycosylphosphotransferase